MPVLIAGGAWCFRAFLMLMIMHGSFDPNCRVLVLFSSAHALQVR
jgi:hypothetical protein